MERSTKNTLLAVGLTSILTLSGSWVSYAVSQENHEVRLKAIESENRQLKKKLVELEGSATKIKLNTQQINNNSSDIVKLNEGYSEMREQSATLLTVVDNLNTVARSLSATVNKLEETTVRLDERSKTQKEN